jgi:phosphotransferase system  glucose/maltose/N-acetylglucosamine-specific IIC component
MNETTMLVSQLAGPIIVAMGLGMLLNMKYYKKLYDVFSGSPFTVVVAAMASMLVGLLIVLDHNLWSTPQEIVVSIFGWAALVKGVLYFLAPTVLGKIGKAIVSKGLLTFAGILALALGGYMSWVGFFA